MNAVVGAVFFITCLLMPGRAVCDQSEAGHWVAQLEKRYASMQDFSALFEQESWTPSVKVKQKGSGSVYFKKGGLMLWDYRAPEPQKIVFDGRHLWIYLPEEKQAMKSDMDSLPSHILADLFGGTIRIQDHFAVSLVPPAGAGRDVPVKLKLTPRRHDPSMVKLIITLDADTCLVTGTVIEDAFGNTTDLRFRESAFNTGLDNALFVFSPPPGTDIVEGPRVE